MARAGRDGESHRWPTTAAGDLWSDLREFPAAADAPLVLKASVLPSRTVEFVELVLRDRSAGLDPGPRRQRHRHRAVRRVRRRRCFAHA